jgi:hypothetical protein
MYGCASWALSVESGSMRCMLSDPVSMGPMDLSQLQPRWQVLEQLYGILRRTLASREDLVLSDRMIDESQTSGRRTYMAVHRCLSVAWDNHDALLALLKHHGATQFAPWNLLRPTFEAAFYAVWLLDPSESVERRRRGLRFEWLDELEHRVYYSDVDKLERFVDDGDRDVYERDQARLADVSADHDAVYRAEADALRLAWPLPRKINVLDELGKLSELQFMDGSDLVLRSTWRTLSGMQHGRGSTMVRGSDRTNETPIEGGVHALLSNNDDAFTVAATMTNALHQQAVMLLSNRSAPS